jgi:predicted transcriptional regulator
MEKINVKTASTGVIQKAIGQAIKKQIATSYTIAEFETISGVSRSSLYRFFNGEYVGMDIVIMVLQALGRDQALEELLSLPDHPAI